METKKLIGKITIPKYIREIELSKAQREKYYEWNGTTIKSGSKKLLQKYIRSVSKESLIQNGGNVHPSYLKDDYCIIGFKGDKIFSRISSLGLETSPYILTKSQLKKPTKYILCEAVGTVDKITNKYKTEYVKVIANETQAGQPRMHIIKGQDFYVGLNPHTRNKIVSELKRSYYDKIATVDGMAINKLRWTIKASYPLYIEVEIRDTIKSTFGRVAKDEENPGTRWDVGNRADPYLKTFLDFMANGYRDEKNAHFFEPLITDDDRLHISSGNNAFFTPIDNEEDRELVVYIYKDTRSVWGRWFNKYRKYITI